MSRGAPPMTRAAPHRATAPMSSGSVRASPSDFRSAGLPMPWPRFASISANTLVSTGCLFSKDLMQSKSSYSYRQALQACNAFTTCAKYGDNACVQMARDARVRVKAEERSMLDRANGVLEHRLPNRKDGWRFGSTTSLQPSMHRHDALSYLIFFSKLTRPGTYFEIGGDDGRHSNTLFFDHVLGWKGALVEPSPDRFKLLQTNRPDAATFNLCAHPNKTSLTMYGGTAMRTVEDNKDVIARRVKYYKKSAASELDQILVKCATMASIVASAKLPHIDFFSLDVEGSELLTLLSFGWSVPVQVLTVERNQHNEAINTMLLARGFEYVRDYLGDRLWANSTWVDSMGINRA